MQIWKKKKKILKTNFKLEHKIVLTLKSNIEILSLFDIENSLRKLSTTIFKTNRIIRVLVKTFAEVRRNYLQLLFLAKIVIILDSNKFNKKDVSKFLNAFWILLDDTIFRIIDKYFVLICLNSILSKKSVLLYVKDYIYSDNLCLFLDRKLQILKIVLKIANNKSRKFL